MGVKIDRAPSLEELLRGLYEPIRYLASSRLTCAAAGDYAALDVWSASATNNAGRATKVSGLSRSPGGAAVLRTIRAVCSEDSVLNRIRLHFFREEPLVVDVEMDDNAGFDLLTLRGAGYYVGSVLLNAFVDRGTAVAVSETTGMEHALRTHETTGDLWYVATTEDAETNETANMTVDFDFYGL